MKNLIKTLSAVSTLGLLLGCASSKGGADSAKYHCSLTGKDLAECCCTKKDGKLYCNETKQFIDKCCCTKM